MSGLQEGIDFIMLNRAFFAFLAAVVGYIIAKAKGARKDERIERQEAALEGVAKAVEEFQESMNRRDTLASEDPKALKKAIAYRVSRGREELDEAIKRLESRRGKESRARTLSEAAWSMIRAALP